MGLTRSVYTRVSALIHTPHTEIRESGWESWHLGGRVRLTTEFKASLVDIVSSRAARAML